VTAPETLAALLQGAGLGFAIAAPVGPIGLLCIRRTLAEGPATGLATGLGAAAADAVYGLVVALGLGALAGLLLEHAVLLRLGGGLLLAWLGLAAIRSARRGRRAEAAGGAGRAGLAAAFASSFALTLANPLTILSFAGFVAAFAGPAGGAGAAVPLVAGVFLGSMLWWLLLVGGVAAAGRSLPAEAQRWIEGASGLVLLGFGAATALSLA
jgi:threonine/homoserine/homoserine lactone efflux protein